MFYIDSKKDKPDIEYMYKKLVDISKRGIKVKDLEESYTKFLKVLNGLAYDIDKQYGISNPNSHKQLMYYLESLNDQTVYDACCVDGKWTTKADNLKVLDNQGYQLATDILAYRKIHEYTKSLKKLIDYKDKDNLVHPEVSLTKTNRVSYRNPPLMSIPKAILGNIIEPINKGNVLYSVDIKNQEPSIVVNMLGAEELKEGLLDEQGFYRSIFTRPFKKCAKLNIGVSEKGDRRILNTQDMSTNENIPPVYYSPIKPLLVNTYFNNEKVMLIGMCNTVTTKGVEPIYPKTVTIQTTEGNTYDLEVEWDNIEEKQLNKVGIHQVLGEVKGLEYTIDKKSLTEFKVSWNAMTYGATINGIRNICKTVNADSLYRYFSNMKVYKEYRTKCSRLAKQNIRQVDTYFGTTVYADTYDTRNRLHRVLMDLPIQGTASDILSLLLKHFYTEIETRDLVDKLDVYYTRHDELIIEVSGELLSDIGKESVEDILRDLFEHKVDKWTPFKVEVEEIKQTKIAMFDTDEADILD